MAAQVQCLRCGRLAEGLQRPPYPGPLGVEIAAASCRDCWNLWRENEVRVINELRLNFLDPAAQVALEQQLREFLRLPAVGS
ncbi:MAG TPA: Fe(2+)-trafficking protein [Thermoanaerobaculia bacterium]|nr:Fe(2+)-trafficking protein [Thermoanaerobaculia bacterium]